MDIVEFAESFMNVRLQEWQKNTIRTLDKMGKDAKICVAMPRHMGRDQAVYIYMKQKELILNDASNDCK